MKWLLALFILLLVLGLFFSDDLRQLGGASGGSTESDLESVEKQPPPSTPE